MIEVLLGSQNSERVLIYLTARGEGYAKGIADFYEVALFPVQKQLEKLETGGVLISRNVGRTRLYEFNPRFSFLKELTALLEKVLGYYPEALRETLIQNRRRPRKKDKPL